MAKGPVPRPPVERFWTHVRKTDTCWIWTGSKAGNYGGFWISGQGRERVRDYAHRFAYELLVAPIPAGLQINHLCENKLCVRPDHLEIVTQRENNRYGSHPAASRARQTLCIHGHPLDGVKKNGCRYCKTCNTINARKRYHRLKRDHRPVPA